jgi:hypothetical protein
VTASPLVIKAGQNSGTIAGTLLDDGKYSRFNKTLTLTLGTPTGAALGATTTDTITIVESDPKPSAAFAVLANNSLLEFLNGSPTPLSPAGTVLAVSGVIDGVGSDVAFAVTADHHLWEHSPALPGDGWVMLSAGSFQQVSATTNFLGDAVVFAVLTDNSLWEYSSLFSGDHWRMLSPGGTILSVSAVTDASGNDDVYAITANHNLWEHTPAAWVFLSPGSFQQVSAGLNGAGQAVVYAVLTDDSLWENNPAFGGQGWRLLSPSGTILAAAAAGTDQVFAVTADHTLWQHLLMGWSPSSSGSFQSASGTETASGTGDLFAVLSDGSLWEYNAAFAGTHWRELYPAGVFAAAAAV